MSTRRQELLSAIRERLLILWTISVGMSGCVTPPPAEEPARPAPVPVAPQAAPAPAFHAIEVLEARHHERAQAHMQARNWADALVEWELLTLLKPETADYRVALADTRKRIRDTADGLSRAAEQARRQGNIDQAILLYLRMLNVERDNAMAAKALRDIDAERAHRSYINRPPRVVM